jgi:hypothetical protein
MDSPLPSIVKLPGEVFTIAGSALSSVIVPLTVKLIVLGTVGAAFALLIASRKLPVPLSRMLVTVKVPARAIPGIASNKNDNSAKHHFRFAIELPPRPPKEPRETNLAVKPNRANSPIRANVLSIKQSAIDAMAERLVEQHRRQNLVLDRFRLAVGAVDHQPHSANDFARNALTDAKGG